MTDFHPFSDNPQETALTSSTGELTVLSDSGRVSIFGDLEINKDRAGLANALALLGMLQQTVAALQASPLSDVDTGVDPDAIQTRKNPFG